MHDDSTASQNIDRRTATSTGFRPPRISSLGTRRYCESNILNAMNSSRSGTGLDIHELDELMLGVGSSFAKLKHKRLLVTGGTGFLGKWLLDSFCHVNDRLNLEATAVILSRNPNDFLAQFPDLAKRADLQWIAGDVRSFRYPSEAVHFVIHGAFETSAKRHANDPRDVFDVAVDGTRHVLELANQKQIEGFLLISSGAVYGKQPPDVPALAESHLGALDPLDPYSAYALGKSAAEFLCRVAVDRQHLPVKIARCFAFVGPHLPLDAHFAIGNFMRDAQLDGPIHIRGDGTPMRSYLYAAELTQWLWRILFDGPIARAYNVGSPDAVSVLAVANAIVAAWGTGNAITLAHNPVPGSPVARYIPDVSRARTELGLHAQIGLDDAIRRTHRFLACQR